MQKEATAKAQETILEKQREDDTNFFTGSNSGIFKLKSKILISIFILIFQLIIMRQFIVIFV